MLVILHLDYLPHHSSVTAILAQTIPLNCLQSAPICFLCMAYLQSKLEFFVTMFKVDCPPVTYVAGCIIGVCHLKCVPSASCTSHHPSTTTN